MSRLERLTEKFLRLNKQLGPGPLVDTANSWNPEVRIVDGGHVSCATSSPELARFIVLAKDLADEIQKENPVFPPGPK